MRGHVVLVEDLGQFTVMVLHSVALVNDHVLPLDLQEKYQWVVTSVAMVTLASCPLSFMTYS